MARRTKEEAEQTRRQILAAARETFHSRGVGNTSLEHIAQAAGLTRGAIYWHFANKEQLFKAMCQEVTIPLVDQMDYTLLQDPHADPLQRVANFLMQFVAALSQNSSLLSTMEILNFKCEFVGELARDLTDYIERNEECLAKLQQAYLAASRAQQLRPGLTPKLAALETLVFLTGLLRLRLLGVPAFQKCPELKALIAAHVDSRRLCLKSAG
ncbi:TetR family transcriptional regulator [Caldimonas brevitalea]|uniref:TetR/AcrR family transcriptional regulator, acrAB operon repressor n=1 Tax=Caldimonas brevitalea TaxID=413882 RepID=A0A0G3BUV8_9BURK|nr:TetR family transcriptional regulator [Caldimonas brevitalea]AKJ31763.1 TetR/AcrR family transcriptional regulator, acrAB operon repressor [Caldimonas brevitalea]